MGPTPPDRVTPPLAGRDDVGARVPDAGATGPAGGGLVAVDGALAPDDNVAPPATPALEGPGC